jgi:hypothetical protein
VSGTIVELEVAQKNVCVINKICKINVTKNDLACHGGRAV